MRVHDRPHLSFAGKVSRWFIDTFPNSSITAHNAAVGGVTSTYFGQCIDMFVPDEDVDLVLVDFTLNDRASGVQGKSPEPDTPDRSIPPPLHWLPTWATFASLLLLACLP